MNMTRTERHQAQTSAAQWARFDFCNAAADRLVCIATRDGLTQVALHDPAPEIRELAWTRIGLMDAGQDPRMAHLSPIERN